MNCKAKTMRTREMVTNHRPYNANSLVMHHRTRKRRRSAFGVAKSDASSSLATGTTSFERARANLDGAIQGRWSKLEG